MEFDIDKDHKDGVLDFTYIKYQNTGTGTGDVHVAS